MFRFQPLINGVNIASTLQSDVVSTSLLHPQLILKQTNKKINGNAAESILK